MLLVALILPQMVRCHTHNPAISCANNLRQVGLAFRIWAGDGGDKFPMQVSVTNGGTMELVESGTVFPHFQIMSNELNTPKVLYCRIEFDQAKTQATSFDTSFS